MMRSAGVALAVLSATATAATVQAGWIGTYQTKQTQLVSEKMSDNYLTVSQMSGGDQSTAFACMT